MGRLFLSALNGISSWSSPDGEWDQTVLLTGDKKAPGSRCSEDRDRGEASLVPLQRQGAPTRRRIREDERAAILEKFYVPSSHPPSLSRTNHLFPAMVNHLAASVFFLRAEEEATGFRDVARNTIVSGQT